MQGQHCAGGFVEQSSVSRCNFWQTVWSEEKNGAQLRRRNTKTYERAYTSSGEYWLNALAKVVKGLCWRGVLPRTSRPPLDE